MTQEMAAYYAQRAKEYDKLYELPAWQGGIATLQQRVPAFFAGQRVYEVACGTGYWTQYAAQQAQSVYATDINEETLAIARSRTYERDNVTLMCMDAYGSPDEQHTFDAGFAGFWFSHVDMGRMQDFLAAYHSRLERGSSVLMFDERLTSKRDLPTSRTDAAGNRYEMRTLRNGSAFEIIKNFYTEQQFHELFGDYGHDFAYEGLRSFWVLSYRVK